VKELVIGGSKSGKSDHAQRLAIQAAAGGELWYIATMCPADDEDKKRIDAHRQNRAGTGFKTLELKTVKDLARAPKTGTLLIDSATALLANEMFPHGGFDAAAGERAANALAGLCDGCENIIIVCDDIFHGAGEMPGQSEEFVKGLAHITNTLAQKLGSVTLVRAGRPEKIVPESAPQEQGGENSALHLIFGGVFMGKTAYAKERCNLTPDDIFSCQEGGKIDLSRRCVDNLENFALACAASGEDAAKRLERLMQNEGARAKIFICADISSGVVPADALLRAAREQNGRLLQFLAGRAGEVTQITAGIARRLK
jgi:adenosylcobinamide kinase/adenosylcobinamide-phosphate guanylyltransferase